MTGSTPAPGAESPGGPQEQPASALDDARRQLAELKAHPAYQGDLLAPMITAIAAAIDGLGDFYAGFRSAAQRIVDRFALQELQTAAWLKQQQDGFVKNLTASHAAALARIGAEEKAHEAKIQAGLIGAAEDALKELLKRDRRKERWRWLGIGSGTVAAILLVGFGLGWYSKETYSLAALEHDVQAVAAMDAASKDAAETLHIIADKLTDGMSVSDLLAMAKLHQIVDPNLVTHVPQDDVPIPCIAAVPQGTLLTRAGRPIQACVIALRDSVDIQGGDFLIKAIASRNAAQ
jgi:hypothetical protein